MRLEHLITCDQYIKDAQSGKASYINIFDRVSLRETPPTIASFYVCGRIDDVPPGPIIVRINIFEPDGESIAEETLEGEAAPGSLDFAAYFKLVKFVTPGMYSILVEIDNAELDNNDSSLAVLVGG